MKIHCGANTAIAINVTHHREIWIIYVSDFGRSNHFCDDSGCWCLGFSNITFFATNGKPPDTALIAFILLNFLITYCIARLYYNCQPEEEHALYNNQWHGKTLFSYCHQILFLALLGLGMGIKITGKHLLNTKKYWIDVILPGYSLVIIIICLMFIRISHPYHAHYDLWIFRSGVIMIMAIIPVFALKWNQGFIFMVLFVGVILMVLTDVEGRQTRQEIKRQQKGQEPRDVSLTDSWTYTDTD